MQDPSKTCSSGTAYPGATVTASPAINGQSTFTTNGSGKISLTQITIGGSYTFTLGALNGYSVNNNCSHGSNTINATFSSDNQTLNWYVSPPTPTCTITASPTTINTQPPNNTTTLTTTTTEAQPYSGNFDYKWSPDSVGGSLSPATTTTANKIVTTIYTAPNNDWDSGTTQPQAQVCVAGTDICGSCQVHVNPSSGPPITIVPLHSLSGFVYTDMNKNGQFDSSESDYTTSSLTISICPSQSNSIQEKRFCQGNGGNAINTNSGTFTTGATPVLPPGDYTVSLTSLPDSTYSHASNSSFIITVGKPCPGSEPSGICDSATGNVSAVAFGISNSNVWIQTTGGDVYMGGGITYSTIPSNASAACGGPHMSIPQPPQILMPGIMFTGNGLADFGQGNASVNNWVVGKGPYLNTVKLSQETSYASVKQSMSDNGITPIDLTQGTCSTPNNCVLPDNLTPGVYIVNNSDLTLNGNNNTYTFPSGAYTFLINGTLNINTKILVPGGSVVLFTTSGDIKVNGSIGEADSTSLTPDIEGYYSADGNFIVQNSLNNLSTSNCPTKDLRLNAQGAIVVNANGAGGSFQVKRDMCENDICPTFSIQVRPDFVLNAPSYLMHVTRIWQEIAP